jgi:hypothetical protein
LLPVLGIFAAQLKFGKNQQRSCGGTFAARSALRSVIPGLATRTPCCRQTEDSGPILLSKPTTMFDDEFEGYTNCCLRAWDRRPGTNRLVPTRHPAGAENVALNLAYDSLKECSCSMASLLTCQQNQLWKLEEDRVVRSIHPGENRKRVFLGGSVGRGSCHVVF